MIRCTRCSTLKDPEEFTKDSRKRNGRQSYCRECMYEYRRAWTSANPWHYRAQWARGRGINVTASELQTAYEEQGGRCAVCGSDGSEQERFLHIDHSHDTGRFRAWLCSGCNSAEGHLGSDPDRARALAEYMEAQTQLDKNAKAEAHLNRVIVEQRDGGGNIISRHYADTGEPVIEGQEKLYDEDDPERPF